MSDIAIRVENLGKQYRIGTRQRGYKTIRESITDALTSPFLRWRDRGRATIDDSPGHPSSVFGPSNSQSAIRNSQSDTIWALKDVSFDVKQGEVIGIIGRNGAGKSTLLKILSRITRPTEGRAVVSGRVGSLLEVGTGFHPELTGRENILLNGAILGMRKAEIERKFEEIVAFAEVEKFIDTPVKHYSSGMYVRLAFAVAAHLEPEILLVDEVLAVGDGAFQKKCLGKMDSVAEGGRTILFVSHNMAAIRRLCHTAILLTGGQVTASGPTDEIAHAYESLLLMGQPDSLPAGVLYEANEAAHQKSFAITRIELRDSLGAAKPSLAVWDAVCFRIHYHALEPLAEASAVLWLMSPEGVHLLLCSTQPDSNVSMPIKSGYGTVDCFFPQWPFTAGRYYVDAALALPMKEYLSRLPEPMPLEVQPRDVFVSGRVVPEARRALVAIPHQWKLGE